MVDVLAVENLLARSPILLSRQAFNSIQSMQRGINHVPLRYPSYAASDTV